VDGRIQEVAIDRYAQADDGSVWYFGEDYSAFEEGKVTDTEGTSVRQSSNDRAACPGAGQRPKPVPPPLLKLKLHVRRPMGAS